MLKLLKYLKKYTKECILSPIFKLIEAVFELIVPLVVASIIDIGISGGDKGHIVNMCLLLGGFAVLGLACALCAQFFAAKAAVGMATDIRHKLFAHIGKLSFSQLDNKSASTLINGMTTDINLVQSGVNLTFRLILRSPIVVFGAVIMAFTVDVKTALVFAVAVPVLAVAVVLIMLATIPLYKRVQQRLDDVLKATRENLTGTRVIRAFCKENSEIKEFDNQNNLLLKIQIVVGKISAFMNPITYLMVNLAVIALIYIGAVSVNSGDISSGAVVAQYNYMSQILVELIKLASLIITITKAIAGGNRIEALLKIEPDLISGDVKKSEKKENIIEFNNVSLCYGGDENALQNIFFSVKRGQTVGIIGSTGSGKSSLIHLIPRFYDATSGQVLIDGINVRDYDLDYLRGKIGIVAQKKSLFRGSVRDNIRFGKENASDDEIWSALEIAQAKDMVEQKEGGLDFIVEQDGKNLSGGQRQRLTIARALVRKPEILILDDATSALDYVTAARFSNALKNADFKPTVLIVSQRVSAIKNADIIVVLEEGEMAGIGTSEELLATSDVFREICTSQSEGGAAL